MSSEHPILSSKLFRRGVHDCPLCATELASAAPACSRCGCKLEKLDKTLGLEGPHLKAVMDLTQLLGGKNEAIQKQISLIERQFPQLALHSCIAPCPDGVQPTALAWWMLNRGQNLSHPTWAGLLLIDLKSSQVTFQMGYDLSTFINRQKLEALLSECGDWFSLGDYAGGIVNFFQEFHTLLKRSHRHALETEKMTFKTLNRA